MKIQEYLETKHVAFEEREHVPAYTAQEVAAQEHVSGKMLAKAVIVKADDRFVLCVLPASYKLDMEKVALALGADQVYLADETDLAKLFPDSEVGAEPPFGNLYDLPTLVDVTLTNDKEIVFQAHSHSRAIRMLFEDYQALVQPEIADISIKSI